jgi:hypothetical protein
MTAADLTWSGVLAFRAGRQALDERAGAGSEEAVVSRLAGLHAQVASAAELALWARVEGVSPGWTAGALERRVLVKTWAMRGTLHLLPATELGTYVAAQAVLPPRHGKGSWLKAYGLSAAEAEAMLTAIPRVLDGPPLTREALAEAVAVETGIAGLADALRDGFGALLKPAAFAGDLCFADPEGRNVRFTRPDLLLGVALDRPEPADAMRVVVRRYLGTYGPASREELARWFGMSSPALAGRCLKALGEEAVQVAVEGDEVWALAADVEALAAAEPSGAVRLLPAFDPHVVAAPRERESVLPAARRGEVYRPQGWLSPVLVVDGRIAGTWSHERRGETLAVEVTPWADPGAAVRDGVAAEAERLATFLGGELHLTIRR